MPLIIYALLILFAALLAYAALLAAKRTHHFTASGANTDLLAKHEYEGFGLQGGLLPRTHRSPFAHILPMPQCSTGTTQSRPFPARAGKVMESAGQYETKPRRTASVELSWLESSEGTKSGTIRPTLNRKAHNLGRWLAISPTFNFPVRDSHLGSSEKGRSSKTY